MRIPLEIMTAQQQRRRQIKMMDIENLKARIRRKQAEIEDKSAELERMLEKAKREETARSRQNMIVLGTEVTRICTEPANDALAEEIRVHLRKAAIPGSVKVEILRVLGERK